MKGTYEFHYSKGTAEGKLNQLFTVPHSLWSEMAYNIAGLADG
jgi:hypothetical protein